MRILFDTNVVLDVLLDRKPFSFASAKLLSKVESGELSGFVCATTITTIHYLTRKVVGLESAAQEIAKLMNLFEIAPVNRVVSDSALSSGFLDFEDAVIHESARFSDAGGIVTRDPDGFKNSIIQIYSPEELLLMLTSINSSAT